MSRRGFALGTHCKVWEIEKKNDKWCKCRITITHKEDDGTYKQDFGSYVDFRGEAAKQIMEEGEGAFVRLTDISVTNKYDKEKKVMYTNFNVFRIGDDDDDDEAPAQNKANKQDDDFVQVASIENDDDMPF